MLPSVLRTGCVCPDGNSGSAGAGIEPTILDWDSVIYGRAIETITPDDPQAAYMERSTEGIFILTRTPTPVATPEPPLEEAR